jgi:hypothetical protein
MNGPDVSEPEQRPKKRVVATISIVPEGAIACSLQDQPYDYTADLDFYVEAFRRETQTPPAAIFRQDNLGGYVSLVFPPEYEEPTGEHNGWGYQYGDDIQLYSEEEHTALFQKELAFCAASGKER